MRKRRKGKSERKTRRPKSETEIDYVRVCVFSCASAPLFLLTQRPRASIHDNNVSARKMKQQEKKSSLIPPKHWLHLCTHLIPNICSCEALWTHLASKRPPCISLCFSFIIRLLVHYLWLSSLLFSVAAVGFPATWRSSYCFQMYFCPHSNINFNMALASLTMLFINSQVKHLVASWYNVSFLW